MTSTEIAAEKQKIDSMTHEQMARLWRFATVGQKYFDVRNSEIFNYFAKRFKELGGMTPEISKKIGW